MLGNAYKTLHTPESRRHYDVSGQTGDAVPAEHTFAAVAEQLLQEFLDGSFGNILRGLELVHGLALGEPFERERATELLQGAHAATVRVRRFLDAIQADTARFAELQHELGTLPWTDVTGRALAVVRLGQTATAILGAVPLPDVRVARLVPWGLAAAAWSLARTEAVVLATQHVLVTLTALWTLVVAFLAAALGTVLTTVTGRHPATALKSKHT